MGVILYFLGGINMKRKTVEGGTFLVAGGSSMRYRPNLFKVSFRPARQNGKSHQSIERLERILEVAPNRAERRRQDKERKGND
jgi:hypothetical protein